MAKLIINLVLAAIDLGVRYAVCNGLAGLLGVAVMLALAACGVEPDFAATLAKGFTFFAGWALFAGSFAGRPLRQSEGA